MDQYQEGFSVLRQWHLIGDDESAAHQLIHDCAAFTTTVRNAVWVFEQGFWHPDFALWQAVQKVCAPTLHLCLVEAGWS
jgi:transitional endoplasmic reticulum ATPase